MPRAAQISIEPPSGKSAPNWLGPVRASEEKDAPEAAQPRGAGRRFAMLAGAVAIAASFGAVAGSFGGATFGRAPAEAPVAAHALRSTDEIKALKESVAQLRATTKTLSDNVSSHQAQREQCQRTAREDDRGAGPPRRRTGKRDDRLDPEAAQQAPVVLGAPPAQLQLPIVAGWTLRRVFDGAALIEGRDGPIEVEPGINDSGPRPHRGYQALRGPLGGVHLQGHHRRGQIAARPSRSREALPHTAACGARLGCRIYGSQAMTRVSLRSFWRGLPSRFCRGRRCARRAQRRP